MVRRSTAGLIIVLICVGMPFGSVDGHPAVAAGTACAEISMQYQLTCYTPQEKRLAQRRFAVRPIDPSRIVERLTHQPLTLVSIGQADLGETGKESPKATILEYDFGPVPSESLLTPTPVPSAPPPRWTYVSEHTLTPHVQRVSGVLVTRFTSGGAKWLLAETLLKHHRLEVGVVSTENRATVVAIGRALRKLDKKA